MLPTRLTAAALLAVSAMFSGGCLIMTGSSIEEQGVRISGETLTRVAPGETTEAWLLAALGEPTTRTPVGEDERTVILKYRYCQTKAEGGAVFIVFAGGSSTETTTTTYFELIDGVVSRFWTEG